MKYFTTLLFLVFTFSLFSQEYHVSKDGNDGNPGTFSDPWKSIQFGMEEATPGSTVFIHGGNYNEPLYCEVSGQENQIIKFVAYNDEEVIIDGSSFDSYAMLEIYDKHHILIDGLIFQNFVQNDAVGILVEGKCNDITIQNCTIRNINFSSNPSENVNENTNSQPLIVYGTESSHPIKNLQILSNQIYDCRTGYSEALAVNGNIDGFVISENIIHDISNIGIDIIGHEETCPDPFFDQARNGLVSKNKTYRCISPYASSAGIYVDGGKDLIIENNIVYDNQWGIEIGCENVGKSTSNIVVRNNFVFNNFSAGIHSGGYDYPNGSGKVTNVQIVNNSLYSNDQEEDYTGEIYLSYNENLKVFNNIFYATNQPGMLLSTEDLNEQSSNVEIQFNNWFANEIEGFGFFYFNGVEYESVMQFGNALSFVADNVSANPIFKSTNEEIDLHLSAGSPLIDRGMQGGGLNYGSFDIDYEDRIQGGGIDIGADEFATSSPVEELVISDKFQIYPNPAKDIINFDLNEGGVKIEYIKILDIGGKLIHSGSFDQCHDISNYKSGIYHIQFFGNKKVQFSSRFVKI